MEMGTKQNTRVAGRKLKMDRVIIAGAVAGSLLFGGMVAGYSAMADFFNPAKENTQMAESLDNITELTKKEGSGFDVSVSWGDSEIQDIIHQMTHQKVRASQKWGSIEITEERVETLSQIIDENEDYLEYYETYRDIVDNWLNGDFGRADKDHNEMWRLQDGTIGKAKGLLSDDEEKEFITDVFE